MFARVQRYGNPEKLLGAYSMLLLKRRTHRKHTYYTYRVEVWTCREKQIRYDEIYFIMLISKLNEQKSKNKILYPMPHSGTELCGFILPISCLIISKIFELYFNIIKSKIWINDLIMKQWYATYVCLFFYLCVTRTYIYIYIYIYVHTQCLNAAAVNSTHHVWWCYSFWFSWTLLVSVVSPSLVDWIHV